MSTTLLLVVHKCLVKINKKHIIGSYTRMNIGSYTRMNVSSRRVCIWTKAHSSTIRLLALRPDGSRVVCVSFRTVDRIKLLQWGETDWIKSAITHRRLVGTILGKVFWPGAQRRLVMLSRLRVLKASRKLRGDQPRYMWRDKDMSRKVASESAPGNGMCHVMRALDIVITFVRITHTYLLSAKSKLEKSDVFRRYVHYT